MDFVSIKNDQAFCWNGKHNGSVIPPFTKELHGVINRNFFSIFKSIEAQIFLDFACKWNPYFEFIIFSKNLKPKGIEPVSCAFRWLTISFSQLFYETEIDEIRTKDRSNNAPAIHCCPYFIAL